MPKPLNEEQKSALVRAWQSLFRAAGAKRSDVYTLLGMNHGPTQTEPTFREFLSGFLRPLPDTPEKKLVAKAALNRWREARDWGRYAWGKMADEKQKQAKMS